MNDLEKNNAIDLNRSELKMYTRSEVAELLGCHKDNVTMLTETNCIQSIKIGKCYMYSYKAIEKFEREYQGYDVSNKVKAIKAYQLVNGIN